MWAISQTVISDLALNTKYNYNGMLKEYIHAHRPWAIIYWIKLLDEMLSLPLCTTSKFSMNPSFYITKDPINFINLLDRIERCTECGIWQNRIFLQFSNSLKFIIISFIPMQLSELPKGPSFSKWYIKPKKRFLNLKFWLVK